MYKILLETEKNQFERNTKEELEEALLNLNGYFKEISKKENIRIYKTNQGNIKDEIVFSLPKEKDEISNCLEKFCLEKEEVNEEKEEAYKQEQETKLKDVNDNELDESDKDVYKNIKNQDNEDITVEVAPSAKERQKEIRKGIEIKKEKEKSKYEEKEIREVDPQEREEQQQQETKAKAEEIKQEKAEEIKTKQNQELLANSEKENIVYVPTNIKTANLIMCRNFERMLGETQGEIKKLEKIIEAYKKQIFELKKVEKRTNEMLETL